RNDLSYHQLFGHVCFPFFLKFLEREMSYRPFEDMFAPNDGRIRNLCVPAIAYPDEPEICATNSTKCSFAPRILFHFGASSAEPMPFPLIPHRTRHPHRPPVHKREIARDAPAFPRGEYDKVADRCASSYWEWVAPAPCSLNCSCARDTRSGAAIATRTA